MNTQFSEAELPQYPCIIPIASFNVCETTSEIEILIHGSRYGSFSCDEAGINLFRTIQPLLDGSRSIETLHLQLGKELNSTNDVCQLLAEMNRFHLLVDMTPKDQSVKKQSIALCQFRWDKSVSQSTNTAANSLSGTRIGIICSDIVGFVVVDGLLLTGADNLSILGPEYLFSTESSPEPIAQTLRNRIPAKVDRIGYENFDLELCHQFCEDLDFAVIVLSGSMSNEAALGINNLLYSKRTKSILMRMRGSSVLLGPLCIPGTETCCYAEVLEPNPFSLKEVNDNLLGFNAPCGPLSFFLSAGYLVSAIVSDVLVKGRRVPFSNQLWISDWAQGNFKTFRILRNPRCSVCGRLSYIPEGRPLDE